MFSTVAAKAFSSRREAVKAKSVRYYTGKLCPRGHIADRYTSNGQCVECLYQQNHSPEVKARRNKIRRFRRKIDQSVRDKNRALCLAYYHKRVSTPEGAAKVKARNAAYYANVEKPRIKQLMKDPEYAENMRKKQRDFSRLRRAVPKLKAQERQNAKKYRLNNKHIFTTLRAKRRARKRNAMPKWLTKKQLGEISDLYKKQQEMRKAGVLCEVDHIIPLSGFTNVCGLHVPWNLQLLTIEEHKQKTKRELMARRFDTETGALTCIYVDLDECDN